MADLENYRKILIDRLRRIPKKYLYISSADFDVKGAESIAEWLDKKTIPELLDIVTRYDFIDSDKYDTEIILAMLSAIQLDGKNDFIKFSTEVKDHQQNITDIVNLFTDIDKNRTNLEDKVNKLETKINNIETSIGQILALLQKS